MKLDQLMLAADLMMHNQDGRDQVKGLIRDTWVMALEEAAAHFDDYTWSPYKSPSITIREMITRAQKGST